MGTKSSTLYGAFFASSGAEANEAAIKLARRYAHEKYGTERYEIIAMLQSFHGRTMATLTATGQEKVQKGFEPLVPGAVKVQTPYRYRCNDCAGNDHCTLRCADDLALRIEMEGPETVAAVFMEPVQNTGGALVPPHGYFARVREICDKYGVLLVSDEVICAFGRLGHMFGCDRFGYRPDMITFAKEIGRAHV